MSTTQKPQQVIFNDVLANILKEAHTQGFLRKSITARDLNSRAIEAIEPRPRTHRTPTACISMFRLALYQRGKAKHIGKLPNGAHPDLEIEFDTADFPE